MRGAPSRPHGAAGDDERWASRPGTRSGLRRAEPRQPYDARQVVAAPGDPPPVRETAEGTRRDMEAKVIKSKGPKGTATVTFSLDPEVGAGTAAVCGEWDGWSTDANVMRRDDAGGFSLSIYLEPGRAYRFRYLLDGERWENDWDADAYVANGFGEDDSVVDLTDLAGVLRRADKRAGAKKGPLDKAESSESTPKALGASNKTRKKKKKKKKKE